MTFAYGSDSLGDCKRFARNIFALGSSTLLQGGMETRDERRRRRLELLCTKHGGVKAIAAKAGLGWEGLDQILKKTPLPEKIGGARSFRSLGDRAAMAIEAAFDLGVGWFDWPFDAVDYKRYWALEPDDRVEAQARMMQAIDELAPMPQPERSEAFKRAQQAAMELSDEERLLLFSAIAQPGLPDHEVEVRIPVTARGLPTSTPLPKKLPEMGTERLDTPRKRSATKKSA